MQMSELHANISRTLPATELKRYLKQAGVNTGALKQAEGLSALVALAQQNKVELTPLKRQKTSVATLAAADREMSTMTGDERVQYEQAYSTALAGALAVGASHEGDLLDATHARRFLARCRLPPERLARVWDTASPDDSPSVDRHTFCKVCHHPDIRSPLVAGTPPAAHLPLLLSRRRRRCF